MDDPKYQIPTETWTRTVKRVNVEYLNNSKAVLLIKLFEYYTLCIVCCRFQKDASLVTPEQLPFKSPSTETDNLDEILDNISKR